MLSLSLLAAVSVLHAPAVPGVQTIVERRFKTVLNPLCKRDDGKPWTGEAVVMQQITPLGFVGDIFPEGRWSAPWKVGH